MRVFGVIMLIALLAMLVWGIKLLNSVMKYPEEKLMQTLVGMGIFAILVLMLVCGFWAFG